MVEDLVGKRFARLIVTSKSSRKKGPYWNCICDCGKEKEVLNYFLHSGRTKSCGCYNIERLKSYGHSCKQDNPKSHTRMYSIWNGMKDRCLNPNNDRYYDYGGRGITLCDKWLSFDGFYEDMKEGYDDLLTIDRIENDKGYSLDNCKWSTNEEQSNNKRTNLKLTFNGETKTAKEFCQIFNINEDTLRSRLKRGWSLERALTCNSKVCKSPRDLSEKIQCACGCGEVIGRFDRYGRERRFISGHNGRKM